MITKVVPPSTWQRTKTVQVVGHRLTPAEAATVCAALAADEQHLPVLAAADARNIVHVWAQRPMTTAEEVTVLRAFAAVSDSRLAWHQAVVR